MQTYFFVVCVLTAAFFGTVCFRPGEATAPWFRPRGETPSASRIHSALLTDKGKRREVTAAKPLVWTNQGLIQGRRIEDQDTGLVHDEYLGIRFARTPKRFQRAKYPPSSWWGIYQANEYPPQCPWVHYGFPWVETALSEDCLFLNIYVPKGFAWGPRAVKVVTHPGGNEFGNAHSFNHKPYTSRGIILVSIAYRLGVFGWTSSASDLIPGNLGLWDQNAGLQWTYDNIVFFGGNKKKITLGGVSCGSYNAIAHLLSPHSAGLFRRIMGMSGSPLGHGWGVKIPCDKQKQYSTWIGNFARSLNCSGSSDKENIRCLQGAPMQDLLRVSNIPENLDYRSPEDRWVAVIDGEFLQGPPKTLYRYLLGSNVDMLLGSGYHDARSFALEDYMEPRPNVTSPAEYYKWRYNEVYHLGDLVRQKSFDLYGLNPNTDPNSEPYVKLMTDETYGSATELDAILHARYTFGRRYNLVWRHRPSFSEYEDWVQGEHRNFAFFWTGLVSKYASLLYPTEDELRHEKDLFDYKANFIENGNPNIGRTVPTQWFPYEGSRHSRNVMEFQVPTEKSKNINKYWGNKSRFWDNIKGRSYGNEDPVCPYAQ